MLYCLVHENVLHEDGLPYRLDLKTLGHYTTLEKAEAARARFNALPGFRDYPQGFGIRVVQPIDGPHDGDPVDVIYRIGYSNPNSVWDSLTFWFDGYYYDLDLAELMCDVLQEDERFCGSDDTVYCYEIPIDGDSARWSMGFVTENDEDRPWSEDEMSEDELPF